jgi:hypothetical protein
MPKARSPRIPDVAAASHELVSGGRGLGRGDPLPAVGWVLWFVAFALCLLRCSSAQFIRAWVSPLLLLHCGLQATGHRLLAALGTKKMS